MTKKPIECFKTNEQFQECCRWWQHKLFLDDWFIKFELTTDKLEVPEEGGILSGACNYIFNNREANIIVSNTNEYDGESPVRNIAELTVVHELLHLKNGYNCEFDAEEKTFHNYIVHQELEAMAKTLIMIKYGVDYNYFLGS